MYNFFVGPAVIFHGIVPCVAHLYVSTNAVVTLQENGVDKETIDEVFSILNSLKGEVLGK